MAQESLQDILKGETPVLIDVFADWCGPCQTMMPEIDSFAEKMGPKVRVLKINVDRNPQFAQAFGIRGVPTLLLFKNEDLVWRASGMHTQQQLEQVTAPHMN
jgi:thioredoxin 1